MASTYSTNLAIELIGTGDQAGSWGNTTNTNLGTLIEQAISGYVTQAVSTGTDTTITIPNGATGVARNMYIELTGTGGTNTNLIVPANKKLYFIFNNTSSGQVTVKVSGQTGVSVPNGKKMVLVSNGTDVVVAENYIADFGSNSATITNLTCTSLTLSNNPTLSGGTANGVLYLNGSKVATSGSALTFDGTTVLTTPRINITNTGTGATFSSSGGSGMRLYGSSGTNQWDIYLNGANVRFSDNTGGGVVKIDTGAVIDGNLGIGTASPASKLDTAGTIRATSQTVPSSGTGAELFYDATNAGLRGYNRTGSAYVNLALNDNVYIGGGSSGNLGIGTASPTSKLDLVGIMQWQATAGTVLGKLTYSGGEPVVLANTGLGLQFFTNNAFAAKIDSSGNLGLGVTPSAWDTSVKVMEFPSSSLAVYNGGITHNAFFDSVNSRWEYRNASSNPATFLNMQGGAFAFNIAGNGTQNNPISFTQAMTLDASGNLGIGTASPLNKLDVRAASDVIANYQTIQAFSTDSAAIDKGAGLALGGYYSGTSSIAMFGSLVGRKENSTAGNFSGYLAFGTNNNATGVTEKMRLDSSGNLGLGVTPSAWGSGSTAFQLGNGAIWKSGSRSVDWITNGYYNGTNYIYSTSNAATYYRQFDGVHSWYNAASGTAGNAISFTQAMTLDASGNLGVGTTSPSNKLHVNAGSTALVSYFNSTSASGAYSAWYNSDAVNGSVGAAAAIISGGSASNFAIRAESALCFATSGNTERARITSTGQFLMGTTGGSADKMEIQGSETLAIWINLSASDANYKTTMAFTDNVGNIRGTIKVNNAGAQYNTTSDRRLKENISAADDAGSVIDAIQIVKHDWKVGGHVRYGVIAQDLNEVAPEAVAIGEPDDVEELKNPWGVDYSKLVPMLVKEIQSLRSRVAALEAK